MGILNDLGTANYVAFTDPGLDFNVYSITYACFDKRVFIFVVSLFYIDIGLLIYKLECTFGY